MNKEILIALSFPFLLIKDVKASEPVRVESNNHSLSYKNGLNYLPYLNGVSNNKVKQTENFIENLVKKYNTKDPYQLDEYSADLFSEGNTQEAAALLIAAGIYGHNETQDFLNTIDKDFLKYLTSSEARSAKAIKYYESILLPKVQEELESQAKQMEEAADKIIALPGMKEKKEIHMTFGTWPASQ